MTATRNTPGEPMPETDILNPKPEWEADIDDSMCPDYGFTRKRASTLLKKKAAGGLPWTRETQNLGHQFTLSWVSRSFACVQRLKWYQENYEDGYFTIIDHDGGGRHYVGRFTSEVNAVQTGNRKWDVQNLVFEELPRVPMIEYPDDWFHDAIRLYVQNDFGDQKLATSGVWATNTRTINSQDELTMDNAGTAGDWAQYEYRGYGFQLYMLQGPSYGQVDVYLDGTKLQTVDLYSAQEMEPKAVLVQESVSLDFHRVKAVVTGAKNASSSG